MYVCILYVSVCVFMFIPCMCVCVCHQSGHPVKPLAGVHSIRAAAAAPAVHLCPPPTAPPSLQPGTPLQTNALLHTLYVLANTGTAGIHQCSRGTTACEHQQFTRKQIYIRKLHGTVMVTESSKYLRLVPSANPEE